MKMERNKDNFQFSIIKMVALIQLLRILSKLSPIKVDKVSYTFSLLFTFTTKWRRGDHLSIFCLISPESPERDGRQRLHTGEWGVESRDLAFMAGVRRKNITSRRGSGKFEKMFLFLFFFFNWKIFNPKQTLISQKKNTAMYLFIFIWV